MPVVIAPRFNGPPASGHGGYSCGCAAAQVDGTSVEVTLRRPPPLGVELRVAHEDGIASLLDGDAVVASARPAALEIDGPPPAGHDEATAASQRFVWEHDHPFPTCFGCGPR